MCAPRMFPEPSGVEHVCEDGHSWLVQFRLFGEWHRPVPYRIVCEDHREMCDQCEAGNCVQRIERYYSDDGDDWTDVWVHGVLSMMN